MYLSWEEKTITDFSDKNISTLYNQGYVFTRIGKGVMNQTRSVRIDLSKFELSSENKRVLKKNNGLKINTNEIPFIGYNWQIGKIAKDFYDTKFAKGIFSANKIKELLTNKEKSNFNTLFLYDFPDEMLGYAICYVNSDMAHYSYPFYKLETNTLSNIGMGMMVKAIEWAKDNNKKYIYLGSAQRPSDVYKLQFKGLEWWNKKKWDTDAEKLKDILKK